MNIIVELVILKMKMIIAVGLIEVQVHIGGGGIQMVHWLLINHRLIIVLIINQVC
jgi:hypothetical protein